MEEELDHGGPAFPAEGGINSGLYAHPGMTLREWYAGMALQGLLANGDALDEPWFDRIVCSEFARIAFKVADAMIAVGKAKP